MTVPTSPDTLTEPIGWRFWFLENDGRLRSPITATSSYMSEQLMMATCHRAGHEPPASSCTCGVYAWTVLDPLWPYVYALEAKRHPMAVTQVRLIGRVEPMPGSAVRASGLTLERAWVDSPDIAPRVEDRFGVPVSVVPRSAGVSWTASLARTGQLPGSKPSPVLAVDARSITAALRRAAAPRGAAAKGLANLARPR